MKASRLGPARLPGIGRVGAGHCTIFSQHRQDFFGRATSISFSRAVIMSRIWLTSSPTRRRAPPQSGPLSPGSSSCRSRGVSGVTPEWRHGAFSGASPFPEPRRRPVYPALWRPVRSRRFPARVAGRLPPRIPAALERECQLLDRAGDLLGSFAERLPLQARDLHPERLHEEVMRAQRGLQPKDHHLQGGGVVRQGRGGARHGFLLPCRHRKSQQNSGKATL
jgi:hypothetical protein